MRFKMKPKRLSRRLCGVAIAMAAVLGVVRAGERVAVLGDSITYGGRWATKVESAMRETPRFADAEIVNFGLGSENVSGLSEPGHAGGKFPRPCLFERLGRILDQFKPTLVIACYGMNDGIGMPPDPVRMKAFQDGMNRLRQEVGGRGARLVLVTAPLHRPDKPSADPGRYDVVLDEFARWQTERRADGWEVIDIRPDLKKSVAGAKSRDPKFVYASDGVHPGDEGHDFIAESVCRGLWPLLDLPGDPKPADGLALQILQQRNEVLKLAWLTRTGHKRPGIPAGLPMDEAVAKAERLLGDYRAARSMKVSPWQGFERTDFTLDGRAALLVKPESPAKGRPWIWRTEFFGHQPQADLALLKQGFHVAYIDVQNLYGAPRALDAMDGFHRWLTAYLGLSDRAVLEGFSRGGLFAFNWAARHPSKVAALYVDAPVCDFKSWPGGKGKGKGSPADWSRLLDVYGLTEAAAMTFDGNPVDRLESLAKAGIPILSVVGQADDVVPVEENTDVVEKRYRELGGHIEVIRKPGVGHHPHSLEDPQPIVDFVLKAVAAGG